MKRKTKRKGVPLRQLIAYRLAGRAYGRISPTQRLADELVEIFSRDRSVKDPRAAAHKLLCRADRRALGERGYGFGYGSFAPSIKTRNGR